MVANGRVVLPLLRQELSFVSAPAAVLMLFDLVVFQLGSCSLSDHAAKFNPVHI
jgi:hypothetical protein